MKIEKAIEILQDILTFVRPGDPPEEHDAIKLGIEALKAIQQYRLGPPHYLYKPIPGED